MPFLRGFCKSNYVSVSNSLCPFRKSLGKGIVLRIKNEADIWLSVVCDAPIFVQSFHLDIQAHRCISDEPHRFVKGTTVKVFDLRQLKDELIQRNAFRRYWNHINQGNASADALGHDVEKLKLEATKGYGVDDLRRLCTIRLSLGKGYGLAYQRPKIENCPCWVEIRITRALQILDEIMHL